MLSNQLASALAPFALIVNRSALSPVYRSLLIEPDRVRAASAYGILQASIGLGLPEPIVVDAASFIAVIKSLSSHEEVALEIKAGALHWECGMATGRLALASKEIIIPSITAIPNEPPYRLDKRSREDFAEALDLGGLSCGPVSMASAGIYGVVIDNRANLSILSSDSVTMAKCLLSPTMDLFPEMIVISPEAADMLVAVLAKAAGDAVVSLAIGSSAIFAQVEAYQLLIRPIPALKHDLRAITDNFPECEVLMAIPQERVIAFIKRAAALAENKQNAHVVLQAVSGAMSLSFLEGASASEEYYLVDGLDVPDLPPIVLDASRTARALAHSSHIGLDHIERGIIVLTGKAPPFSYYISGRRDKP